MVRAASVAVLALLALAGCAPTTSAPAEVTVSVYQPRPDVAAGRIAIQVHNGGTEPLTITGARLQSTYFIDDLTWAGDREPVVRAGLSLDLRVPLADSDCTEGIDAAHTVVLDYRVGDRTGTIELVPDDPFELLPRLRDAACLWVRVGEIVELTAVSVAAPNTLGSPGQVVIAVTPTGAPGTVTVDAAFSTTLLAPALDGVGIGELPLGVELGADGPTEFRVPIVPNRCDAHALAEDKVGTRLPLEVTVSTGARGRLILSASDELRGQMYAFYAGYCGL
jgi:hypothetical protein